MADKEDKMPLKTPIMVTTPLSSKPYLFQPGNKQFKPKGIVELRTAARNMSLEMLNVMIRIAMDEDERGSVRLAAADMVMTRGYGKAESYHDKEDAALTMRPAELTSSQIMQMLEAVKSADPADTEPAVEADTLTQANSEQLALTQQPDNKAES